MKHRLYCLWFLKVRPVTFPFVPTDPQKEAVLSSSLSFSRNHRLLHLMARDGVQVAKQLGTQSLNLGPDPLHLLPWSMTHQYLPCCGPRRWAMSWQAVPASCCCSLACSSVPSSSCSGCLFSSMAPSTIPTCRQSATLAPCISTTGERSPPSRQRNLWENCCKAP